MTKSDGPVVVGLDSVTTTAAGDIAVVALGVWEATRRHVGLRLICGHDTAPPWASATAYAGEVTRGPARRAVDRAVERTAAGSPQLAVTGTLDDGSQARALVAASATASLVVVAADARIHYGGLLAGLVCVQVAAYAHTPVIVVPPPGVRPRPSGPAQVVVGVDGSPASAEAMAFAFDEAQARHATLHAVYAWEPRPASQHGPDVGPLEAAADRMLREATGPWEDKYPDVPVFHTAVHGDSPVRALHDAGEGADLIVVGSRGHGGFHGLHLGTVSDGLVRYSRRTIAIARPGPQPSRSDHIGHDPLPAARHGHPTEAEGPVS